MNEWIKNSGSCNENELESIASEQIENGVYFAEYTDCILLGDYPNEINDITHLKCLRIWNAHREIRFLREYIGDKFNYRTADDTDTPCDCYFDETDYLDIDNSKSKIDCGSIVTIGGGTYQLPKSAVGANRIRIRSYVSYDEDGCAVICDWRVLEFVKGVY